MKKSVLFAVVLSVAACAVSFLSPSGAFAWAGAKASKGPETYMVIKITDENKYTDKATAPNKSKVEFKVISSSQFAEEEKQIKEKNDDNLKDWHDLLINDPQTPRPVKITIKKLKWGYQTQKIAQEYADKLKEEEASKESGAGPNTPAKQ